MWYQSLLRYCNTSGLYMWIFADDLGQRRIAGGWLLMKFICKYIYWIVEDKCILKIYVIRAYFNKVYKLQIKLGK